MESGVYQITNEVNGKRYIGSAVNLEKRRREHFTRLRHDSHPNIHLRRAAKVYGADKFTFKVIVNCAPEHVLSWEQTALDGLIPEYNICRVAGNTLGRKFSEETKQKIGAGNLGKKHPPRSAEYRAKISDRQKGRPKSPEHLAALQRGRSKQVFTEERRAKVSQSLKDSYALGLRSRERPQEYRDKISKSLKGRPLAEETKKKISLSQLGKKKGPYGPKPLKDRQKQSKIPEDVIRQVKAMLAEGKSSAKISAIFGFSKTVPDNIRNGKTYEWVK